MLADVSQLATTCLQKLNQNLNIVLAADHESLELRHHKSKLLSNEPRKKWGNFD